MMLVTIYSLLAIGLIMVLSSSQYMALVYYGDGLYFIKRQVAWAGLGLISMFVMMRLRLFQTEAISRPNHCIRVYLFNSCFYTGSQPYRQRRPKVYSRRQGDSSYCLGGYGGGFGGNGNNDLPIPHGQGVFLCLPRKGHPRFRVSLNTISLLSWFRRVTGDRAGPGWAEIPLSARVSYRLHFCRARGRAWLYGSGHCCTALYVLDLAGIPDSDPRFRPLCQTFSHRNYKLYSPANFYQHRNGNRVFAGNRGAAAFHKLRRDFSVVYIAGQRNGSEYIRAHTGKKQGPVGRI